MKKKGGTPAGYHFLKTYQDCQWKFFLNYVAKYKPTSIGSVLLFGTAIHGMKEFFYKESKMRATKEDLISIFRSEIESNSDKYERPETLEKDLLRGVMMTSTWYDTWADWDRKNIDIIECEEEYAVEIHPGEGYIPLTVTIKPDLVYFDKTVRHMFVMDTKTTGYSVPVWLENFRKQNQVTMYVYGLKKKGLPIEGGKVEVLYSKGKVSKAVRGECIYRTKLALDEFEEEIYSLAMEISNKVKNLQHTPLHMLFRRRGSCDGDGSWKCAYEGICRNWRMFDRIPPGFEREEQR